MSIIMRVSLAVCCVVSTLAPMLFGVEAWPWWLYCLFWGNLTFMEMVDIGRKVNEWKRIEKKYAETAEYLRTPDRPRPVA
jgi:hypothetical protein